MGILLTAVGVSAFLLLNASPVSAKTFADILGTSFAKKVFGAPFASSVGRSLPLISASSGVAFSFDPVTGTFERETSIAGQLFLERAAPLGRGKWNVNLSYQRVKLDTFEGEDLEDLREANPRTAIIDPISKTRVLFPRFSLHLDTHEVTTSVTYGVTDDLDVNLTIPVLVSEFREELEQTSGSGSLFAAEGATKTGVGDIFLRGKYRVLSWDALQAAVGLVVRLPAGNRDNFQGTGDVELAPMLYVTTRKFEASKWLYLLGYLNAGFDVDASETGSSEGRWGLGLDGGLSDRATLAVAVLGRHAFERLLPSGFTNFTRSDGSSRPLFGIEGTRADIYDFSIGGRVNLWRDTIMVFANAIVPLNRDSVRADVIPTVGLEAAF